MNFTPADYSNKSEDVLSTKAENKWRNHIREIADRGRIFACLNRETNTFVDSYAEHMETRTVFIRYLRDPDNCKKPCKTIP